MKGGRKGWTCFFVNSVAHQAVSAWVCFFSPFVPQAAWACRRYTRNWGVAGGDSVIGE